ncbi:MAG: response regulator [Firmicutes bacterium]|nr:response regulator [Bacillota bacterium]
MDLKEMLEEAGYLVVDEAADGSSAVEIIRRCRPDLVLMDIKMPRMDGLKAAEQISRENLAPVVLLTAYSQKELINVAKSAGVLGYLVKPIRESDLLPMVEVAYSRHCDLVHLHEEVAALQEAVETRKAVERAKGILMEKYRCTEAVAFKKIQRLSMDKQTSMRTVAEAIITANEMEQVCSGKGNRAVRVIR